MNKILRFQKILFFRAKMLNLDQNHLSTGWTAWQFHFVKTLFTVLEDCFASKFFIELFSTFFAGLRYGHNKLAEFWHFILGCHHYLKQDLRPRKILIQKYFVSKATRRSPWSNPHTTFFVSFESGILNRLSQKGQLWHGASKIQEKKLG